VIAVIVSERTLQELRSLCEHHETELHALISQAVSDGARTQDIADAMGISRATLWRRYGSELRRDPGGGPAPR
jgi:hypothetical protein